MGLITPNLADIDLQGWRSRPYLQRIRPLAQHWAENGFGTPYAVYVLYLVKIVGYVLRGVAIAAATPGIGEIGDFASWWTEPIVYQKIVVWTLLYEVLGLGCGSGPLTLRFLPVCPSARSCTGCGPAPSDCLRGRARCHSPVAPAAP